MIDYIHKTHTRSRSIKIKIEPDGQVVVVTPRLVSKRRVAKFVSQSEVWIKKNLAKIKQKKDFSLKEDQLMIFGKKYKKQINYSVKLPVGISIKGQDLIINPANSPQLTTEKKLQAAVEKQLINFLKNLAHKYILPRTRQLAKKMDLKFGKITLRQQKTRWGSCSSSGNLNFNWKLVHCPTQVIDYVIIHELAHRTHMNHSAAFWQLLERYDPEYRVHRGWLKRKGMTLG